MSLLVAIRPRRAAVQNYTCADTTTSALVVTFARAQPNFVVQPVAVESGTGVVVPVLLSDAMSPPDQRVLEAANITSE